MKFGFHVMMRGGIASTLDYAASRGCETMQVFSGNPRQWAPIELEPGSAEAFRAAKRDTGIDLVFFHSIYLINLASPDEVIYEKSRDSLVAALKAADELGIAGVVTHTGNHKGKGEGYGVDRAAGAINEILEASGGRAHLILETTAGSGTSLGYRFDQLAKMIRLAGKSSRLGVCFDTCHVFAAGYDISSADGLVRTLDDFDRSVGLDALELIHANDSREECGSRVDRHEHIGRGKIGLEGFRALVNLSSLSHLPCILETPYRGEEVDARNLDILRSLVK